MAMLTLQRAHQLMRENDGSLYLRGTGITELPDGLTVAGSLYLRGTGITELPDGLTVDESLYLAGTGITKLPDGLTVAGSLDLRGTGITELPDGLTVGESLDLRGTGITELPDGLTVGLSLYLRGTSFPVLFTDERAYELRCVSVGDAEWYVAAGRLFTSKVDALAHWGADAYPDKTRGQAFCAAINKDVVVLGPTSQGES